MCIYINVLLHFRYVFAAYCLLPVGGGELAPAPSGCGASWPWAPRQQALPKRSATGSIGNQ